MKTEIEFATSKLEVTSRGQTVTFDLTKVPEERRAEFFAHAALHGLKQAIGDAAASAKALSTEKDETRTPEEIAADLMAKKVTALESGEWTQRREATPKDPVKAKAFAILRGLLRDNPKYKAADKDGKLALVEAAFAKGEEKLRATASAQLEAERKAANAIDVSDLL